MLSLVALPLVGAWFACLLILVVFGARSWCAWRRPEPTALTVAPESEPDLALGDDGDPPPPPHVTFQIVDADDVEASAATLASIAEVDHPRAALSVQLCHDWSRPASIMAVERLAGEWRARGLDVVRVDRWNRRDGEAGVLNAALHDARGSWLVVAHAGVCLPPDLLRVVLPVFAANARLGVVETACVSADADGNVFTRAAAPSRPTREHAWLDAPGAVGVWRRETVDDCGGWPRGTDVVALHASVVAECRGWDVRRLAAPSAIGRPPATLEALCRERTRRARGRGWLARWLTPRVLDLRAERLARLLDLTAPIVDVAIAGIVLSSWPMVRVVAAMPQLRWLEPVSLVLLAGAAALAAPAIVEAARRGAAAAGIGDTAQALLLDVGLAMCGAQAWLAGFAGAGRLARDSARLDRVAALLQLLAIAAALAALVAGWRRGVYLLPLPACVLAAGSGFVLTLLLRRGPGRSD